MRCGGGGGIGGGDGDANGAGGDFGGDGTGGGDGGSAGGIGDDGGCGGCAGGDGVGVWGFPFGCMGLEGGEGGNGGGEGGDGGTSAGSMGGTSCWRSTDPRRALFPAEQAASMTSMLSARPSISAAQRSDGFIWQVVDGAARAALGHEKGGKQRSARRAGEPGSGDTLLTGPNSAHRRLKRIVGIC